MNARLSAIFPATIAIIIFASISACAPRDSTPPLISKVTISNITGNSAVISWVTNEQSTGEVEYGNTISYGSSTPSEAQAINKHAVTLSGLSENATYHFRVKSRDAAGNDSVSDDYSVNTKITISYWFEHPRIKGFTLLIPRYWQNSFQPSSNILVFLADSEKCGVFEPQISIAKSTSSSSGYTIAGLIEKSKSANKSNNRYEYISARQMSINGTPAGEITWKVTDKDMSGEKWVFVQYDNTVFLFYCAADYTCWDKFKSIFDDIVSSFRIVLKQ